MFPLQAILNWRVFLAVGVLAAAVVWHAAKIHEAYAEGYVAARKEDDAAARQLTAKLTQEKDDALKAAEDRNRAALDAAQRLQRTVDSLRVQLSSAEQRISTAPEAAVREYAAAANAVFGECVEQYRALAVAAQGHANDVQTLIAAWPRP
jgi:excinuclease UvrABC ATPase subunit